MVWDAEEQTSRVVFRWYRSTWTDQLPVTLTISHPFTVVELIWSPLKAVYESRGVLLPFGQFHGSLRVGGASLPVEPFRVNRFTFEVILFLRDIGYGPDELDTARLLPTRWPSLGLSAPAAASPAPPSHLDLQHGRLVTRLAALSLRPSLAPTCASCSGRRAPTSGIWTS
ncbi:uncharacterized protein LOC119100611 [Pollicipes pollicipes]|uniref:uncharacterized protein LOC119100611 n=1 Tax=Pollicipes pollicipes TaxID=41117 RepID=UPI0018850E3D|nr:uncharacterized protein LOC119100611 [Pollicipes pollicipes]